MMQKKRKIGSLLLGTAFVVLLVLFLQPLSVIEFRNKIDVLFPSGPVALKQRNLLLIIQAIMLLVIVPVYILTFIFSWKYRSYNKKAVYDPDLVDNFYAEIVWWGLPLVLTIIIGVLTYIQTQQLDPYKPLVSDKKPLTIQVVALQWKWLFLYPEEKIATLNFVQFPEKTPIRFLITADAPMNSFWIPKLGGQIYAMPKMQTELNLLADEIGEFRGSSANISGEGFAGMHFIAKASSDEDFHQWANQAKQASSQLDWDSYSRLAEPSLNNPVETFQLKDGDLFDRVIRKFMNPPEIDLKSKKR